MGTVNYRLSGCGEAGVSYSLASLGASAVSGQEDSVRRVENILIDEDDYALLQSVVTHLGVSRRFEDVLKAFPTAEGHLPAGFRVETELKAGGLLEADLVRDISYGGDGELRPTSLIFSADSANPYEVAPIAPLLGNLTCNPGIVYDLFINNPKANVGGKFTTRDEVMTELGRVLGPGCDVSVELNNPFESDFNKLLEEAEHFKQILGEYRIIIKVPHMGPTNASNIHQLMEGDKRLDVAYSAPATADAFRSHELALKLREHGYRINYTLMFEPYQTSLALQAKPAFINSFIRHRLTQSSRIKALLESFENSDDARYLEELRTFLLATDYLASGDINHDLLDVRRIGRGLIAYRHVNDEFGADGLDGVRRNLRWLRQSNLPDTRLILCSMEGDSNYPDIDNLLSDPEYEDMIDRVVLTAEPGYLARFTSANQVVSYQRRFMNAAATAK
ncbi:MAG: transaldolase family protein [Propionibacteriaceae bacterium]|nr:transaldolase family protein [Propionibacteriaceae bacterium]